jgi:two-component system response regulator MprA
MAEDAGELIEVGALRIDVTARRAWYHKAEVRLTHTEFSLLLELARHAGEVLHPTHLYTRVWGTDFGRDSKNLAVFIGYLRRKLEDGGRRRLIKTVRRRGYVLMP